MASILPFRALRYNPDRTSLSAVATQPYDKITPAMQSAYYEASPFNLVRIILGKKEPGDTETNNVYSRAGSYFTDWRHQGVLTQDPEPAIYVYSQLFQKPDAGTLLERRGFIALGRVDDYANGVIHRHEQTLAKPKADRLDLLRATRAHFGQIFMLYDDAGDIDRLLQPAGPATAEMTDEHGVLHRYWLVSDPALFGSLRTKMHEKKLIIADGHHRYETALNYRNERRAATPSSPPDAPYEFAMMTFINMNSPGLVILPTHRVVHGLASFDPDAFRSAALPYFNIDEIDATIDAARATAILREGSHAGPTMLAVTRSRTFLLHHPRAPQSIFGNLSIRQQGLDVVQLHKVLLEGVLGLSEESIRNQQNLSYIRDTAEAIAAVHSGDANVAFLMNPCRMDQVRDIAFAGEVLPQKSTDFYPKLLDGLTAYALD
jgi:uncharacterized protein (DUF1015 family)